MNRIKELRTLGKLTQEDLCAVLNVQRSALSKYETGAIPMTDSAVTKLADYFGVTTDYLLGRADDPAPPDAKKAAEGEITFDDFEFALYGEVRELNDEEKAELLKNAQRMNELRKLRNKAADGGE